MIEAKVKAKVGAFLLDAQMNDGGFICLTGRNGSGKSCLLSSIAGKLRIDEGFVRIGGSDVTRLPIERRGVVMVTPGSRIPHLRVDAHLRWGAKLRSVHLDEDYLSRVKADLGIDFDGRVSNLSLGMGERVALATALLARPKAILVDEAFSNIHERDRFIGSYRRLASEAGIDVVFSSQTEEDAAPSDHLYRMTDGVSQRIR